MVKVSVPFFTATAAGEPTKVDTDAAYEMLVEIVTRTSTTSLADSVGSDREAMESLYSLFGTFRSIIRTYGPDGASSRGGGTVSTARIAERVLNAELRPFLTKWHTLLAGKEAQRPPGRLVGVAEWADEPELHEEFRRELNALRVRLREFVFVLGRAARATDFSSLIEDDFKSETIDERRLFSTAAPAGKATLTKPKWRKKSTPMTPRRDMTRWLDPWVALRTVLYRMTTADTRDETAKPIGDAPVPSYADAEDGLWFDYLADMGDAFDPMMEVAWVALRPHLSVGGPTRARFGPVPELPRGDFMILGGDEVYPYPGACNYERQLNLPFSLAAEGIEELPNVWAIPGNHDWLGGLEQWRDLFVDQDNWCGFEAAQKNSWFSVQLPHGWWLWGLDTYLDGSIDQAQRDYFDAAAQQFSPGDQVIVCTPVSAWRLRESEPEHLVILDEFVESIIETNGASAVLFLSGDSHVFASYTRRPSRHGRLEHHVTSGGAGSFLHPTHNLATVVPQTETEATAGLDPASFVGGNFWPPPRNTHKVISGSWWTTVRDRQSTGASLALAALFALYYGLLSIGGSRVDATSGWWETLPRQDLDSLPVEAWGSLPGFGRDFAATLGWILGDFPQFFVTFGLAAFITFCCRMGSAPNTTETEVVRFARKQGLWHGFRHTVSFVGIAALGYTFEQHFSLSSWMMGVSCSLIAAMASVVLLIRYVSQVNRDYRVHDTAAFSFKHLTDGKHFLRCHLSRNGLSLYLIGIEHLTGGWLDAVYEGAEVVPRGTTMDEPVHVATLVWQKNLGPPEAPSS